MKYYCYIRVSTNTQDYDRQYKQLQGWCKKENIDVASIEIYHEKRTGTNYDRPQFLKLMEVMKEHRKIEDCCLILIENTRLGRSYKGNSEMFADLKKYDIKFVVTSMPLLDTRPKADSPTQALIIDIVLSLYNWIAESEHTTLMERTQAGRESAKAKGVKFGRKSITKANIDKDTKAKILEYLKNPKGTKIDLLDSINGALRRKGQKEISRATLYNYISLCQN